MKYRYNLIRSEWGWTLTESGYRLSMGETQRLHEMLSTLQGGQNDIEFYIPWDIVDIQYVDWDNI